MYSYFPEIKKNFGFGCMRLPMIEKEVDTVEFSKMVDAFLENGFNYFDTAQGYLDGKSETALRECLTSRYPRESYILTDKLSPHLFEREEDIRPAFERQLEACGVEYFDFYLMHSQNRNNYGKYQSCRAYEIAQELKAEGKIKHVGFSFHDNAEFLDKILTDHPEIEVVQIQFNYADYDDPSVESKKCYEVCIKHNKPIIVMEPVKGGMLANVPADVEEMFRERSPEMSPASWAIRFAAGLPGVMTVLSGMSDLSQLRDNMGYMADFKPLTDDEVAMVHRAADMINKNIAIPCTGCAYCIVDCPMNIAIPKCFSLYNADVQEKSTLERAWTSQEGYYESLVVNHGKASDCIKCGSCEEMSPQHLPIRELLVTVAKH